ncbi:MAG: hypothetical protein EZS28_048960 [Streblomastix strix]|uniref:Uncharacterized protein n=1 Tax=Streblomastix strix TaxID=222440 RepID=A0A5J4TAW7_9EUKA|nr:MAG: hypothetical protein EZS28_048960 [Streblomastix strix]
MVFLKASSVVPQDLIDSLNSYSLFSPFSFTKFGLHLTLLAVIAILFSLVESYQSIYALISLVDTFYYKDSLTLATKIELSIYELSSLRRLFPNIRIGDIYQ